MERNKKKKVTEITKHSYSLKKYWKSNLKGLKEYMKYVKIYNEEQN